MSRQFRLTRFSLGFVGSTSNPYGAPRLVLTSTRKTWRATSTDSASYSGLGAVSLALSQLLCVGYQPELDRGTLRGWSSLHPLSLHHIVGASGLEPLTSAV